MGVVEKLSGIAARISRGRMVPDANEEVTCISSFVEGVVIPLGSVSDPAFSSGMLGPGCGILPEGELVCAPVDGIVSAIGAPNRHALCLRHNDDFELLIHVGVNTADLRDAFEPLVERGAHVHAGDPLLKFSREAIQAAGCDPVVIATITKGCAENGARLLRQGTVVMGEPLLEIVERD